MGLSVGNGGASERGFGVRLELCSVVDGGQEDSFHLEGSVFDHFGFGLVFGLELCEVDDAGACGIRFVVGL